MTRIVLVVACLLAVSGCEPISSIPGGELAGVVQDAPPEWSQLPETIQLETRPSDHPIRTPQNTHRGHFITCYLSIGT